MTNQTRNNGIVDQALSNVSDAARRAADNPTPIRVAALNSAVAELWRAVYADAAERHVSRAPTPALLALLEQ